MAQLTAKTPVQALNWIDTTAHHYAAVDEAPGFFVLKGYGETLRIPSAIHKQLEGCFKPGDMLDARMYVPTALGRRRLNAAKRRGEL